MNESKNQSEKEKAIVKMWVNGFSIGEIAKALDVSIYDVTGTLGASGYLNRQS